MFEKHSVIPQTDKKGRSIILTYFMGQIKEGIVNISLKIGGE